MHCNRPLARRPQALPSLSSWTRLLATALSLAALAAPAAAQSGDASGPAAGPSDPDAPAARSDALDQQGRDLYRSAQYQQAFDAFAAAHRLVPKPNLLYNMARCLEKMAKYADAVELLERYLQDFRQQTGTEAPNRADVDNLIRTLRQRAFESLPQVTIGSSPSGAAVRLLPEGVALGTTPVTTHMKPGVYKLRMELDQHTPLETDLVVPETGNVRAVFSLQPTVRLAQLSFWCNIRQVKIAVDGKVVALTPFSGRIDVAPGRHQVSMSREGYLPIEEIVDVPENKELHLDYVLQAVTTQASWRAWLGWPLLVAGAGGVGGGVAAGLQADQFYRGTASFQNWAKWQQVGYGAGGGVFALGLGLVIWDAIRDNIPAEDLAPGPPRQTGRRLLPLGEAVEERR